MTKLHVPIPHLGFSQTHVFNLGNDEKVEEGISEIWDDLKDDMKAGVPLPFKDVSCASMVPRLANPFANGKPIEAPPAWIFDRIVEIPVLGEDLKKLTDLVIPETATPAMKEAAARGPLQKLLIMRYEENSNMMISWICYFYGVYDGGIMLTAIPTQQMGLLLRTDVNQGPLMNWCAEESRPVIKQVAVISHPGNYVVRVTPKLTPKEARRVEAGKTFPTQKMPHFVVVDHDILVDMSGRRSGETHASPVPHHRRGHWMRLGERCREARAAGRERVWVRPTYVGDTKFSDLKNDYSVLMDFGKKPELAIGK